MGIDGAHLTRVKAQDASSGKTKEKSLPFAIGLNFILPGAGYMYLGRPFLGVLAMLVVGFVIFTGGLLLLFQAWLGLNVVMAADMLILSNKRKKEITAATSINCPQCAENIKKAAKVCRYCGYKTGN